MGVDLKLIIERSNDKLPMAVNALKLDRDYDLQDRFKQLPWFPLTEKLLYYFDEGPKEIDDDMYGLKLRYVYPQAVSTIKVSKQTTDWNKSVIRFVKNLSPDRIVILFWC